MLGWYNLHFSILKYLGSSIKLKGSELKINTKADFLRQHRGSSWNTKLLEFVKDGCRERILRRIQCYRYATSHKTGSLKKN